MKKFNYKFNYKLDANQIDDFQAIESFQKFVSWIQRRIFNEIKLIIEKNLQKKFTNQMYEIMNYSQS